MKKQLLAVASAMLLGSLTACSSDESSEVGCDCANEALIVTAYNAAGDKVTLDSLQYTVDGGEVVTATDSTELRFGIVGFAEGDYKVWAYFQGTVSDTVEASVRMGGPKECRTLSTVAVEFKFAEKSFKNAAARKIGGCAE